ncbi:MAG: transcription-repair coupling factor [Planctomycetes bacterium]|nr:transcription-repair coupling factor [Planctomycetota bacterium]
MAPNVRTEVSQLQDLVEQLQHSDGFGDVVAALQRAETTTIDGAWGSACALTTAALVTECDNTLLIVLPRVADVDDFALDLLGFLGETPSIFPAWESLPQEHDVSDAVFGGRLRVLRELDTSPPRVVVTSLPALMQPVPSREDRVQGSRLIRVGEEIEPHQLLSWLVERGFERVSSVDAPGEFSIHGGIVDLFPVEGEDPLRIEFFGDEVESIRRFDVETQRKIEDLDETSITAVSPVSHASENESAVDSETSRPSSSGESFLKSLPAGSWIVLTELQELTDEGKHYLSRLSDPRSLFSVQATLAECAKFPTLVVSALAAGGGKATCRLQIESIERFSGPRLSVLEELLSVVGNDEQILIACHNEAEQQRLSELLQELIGNKPEIDASLLERVQLCLGTLSRGFRMVQSGVVVLSDHELFGRTNLRSTVRRKRKFDTRAIDSFLELSEGQLVVHLTHGIGRYRGMKLLENDKQTEEHLVLEFHDGIKVYVPVSLIQLVQKYVGSAKAVPNLSRLGSSSWSKKKQRVAAAVADMAADMLRLQAARESQPGIQFPPDSHWQKEFDAAFPYTETEDQLISIAEVKEDMQKPRPMDRLICGDVGYGKTEIAMRAAFKTIEAGKQVAVLVPTTVLAEQHYRTFCERMAEFPVNIAVLSRFKTKKQQRETLKELEQGTVDLVIGTHRLVQKDVRMKDLGLLIIDEEQRFGVEAKEMLKRLRLEVDVLTMSATPIPRTLHFSLLGIRDISNLTTAPQDRLSIETRIVRFDGELIRNAIVRELNRNGQVFFVHNRVYNIQSVADQIQSFVPEARIGIGHGQMREKDLERAMLDFVAGRIDVLVCTTIIESGLDIPNANTIFIHKAENFGLSDLHQLRGRVGRYKNRAYCYLMLEEGKSLSPTASKRLKAIEEFSELGAGFKIAMRDLEIRGAGNILGTEQSGHISAVGYELYCRLLENAARKLKNEPLRELWHTAIDLPSVAFLPDSYVPPGRQKIEIYRKLATISSLDELRELESELLDRFGPVTEETGRLLQVKQLQLAAQYWQIDDIHLEDHYVVFGYRNPGRIRQLKDTCGFDLRIVDSQSAYLPLPLHFSEESDGLIEHLKSVLQPK